MLKGIGLAIAYGYLILGTLYFGYVGQPAEMGISIVAASTALAFLNLDRIRRFKGAGFEAEMYDQVQAIVAKETEPEPERASGSMLTVRAFGLDAETKQVLLCLGSSTYTWRSAGGIAKETGLPVAAVAKALKWLAEVNLATTSGIRRSANFALTEEGRELRNAVVVEDAH